MKVLVGDVEIGVFDVPPGAMYGPRSIGDAWEFIRVLNGSATWTRPAQRMYMEPGDLVLLPPGPDDAFAWDRSRPTRVAVAHFQLVEGIDGLPSDATPMRRSMTEQDPLASLCDYLVWLGTLPGDGGLERARDVIALLLQIVVAGPQPGRTEVTELPRALRAAAAYAGKTWAIEGVRALTLAELAGAAMVSRRQLSRLTAATFETGPVKAVELARLTRVATLLTRSNLTLSAIAESCGYADPFHLSRRFTAEYGVAPRRYRALARARSLLPEPSAAERLRVFIHMVDTAARDNA